MTPELLYHTTLTVVDYHTDTSGSTRTVYVLGTHTTLPAAKAFSARALSKLGYEPSDFEVYEVRGENAETAWSHGDGVVVFAKAPAGQEFIVGIDTKPNDAAFAGNPDGTLNLPNSDPSNLHYVLQTKIDYDQDRSGAFQTTEIEGCYEHRSEAVSAAKACLRDAEGYQKEDFAQYDERDYEKIPDDWPFGEDVVVHAVSQTGENYTVAIRTIPGAHKKHGKKAGGQK